MSRGEHRPSRPASKGVTRLEKFIEKSVGSDLACPGCGIPLNLDLGGWRLTAGVWEHKCLQGPAAPWHKAIPRRLFNCGLLRPMSTHELLQEAAWTN
jgi:hypothetical protein